MTDEERIASDSDLSPRRWRLSTLRKRRRRVGAVPVGNSKRNRWRLSNVDDRQDVEFDQLQSSVLIQLGLALRAYRSGEPLRAILHLSRAAEAISSLIEAISDSKIEIVIPEEEL